MESHVVPPYHHHTTPFSLGHSRLGVVDYGSDPPRGGYTRALVCQNGYRSNLSTVVVRAVCFRRVVSCFNMRLPCPSPSLLTLTLAEVMCVLLGVLFSLSSSSSSSSSSWERLLGSGSGGAGWGAGTGADG
ncbi:hypothetical protein AALO_G00279060 [Alosa alosa]|uniref:Uncharacterized protein n=1 Tax=Alosa alosa TaxID=278164 RepID=A0AAV6FLY2_9TELE|nr:hypothetical protein AALO_G00279060 [Alosa alosa]